MGIPFYFASLLKSHRGIVQKVRTMKVDVLGIDGNCLIHRYLKDEDPVNSVLDAIASITALCVANKVLFALDGLVPYAKIVQQRYRRMRSATAATAATAFDRNQISPGTPYMKELEAGIRSRFPTFILSSTAEPGEGEHKLFKMMPETSSLCIYGLDADLILLCLARSSLAPEFTLLRESSEMGGGAETYSTLSIPRLKQAIVQSSKMNVDQYIALCILCFGNDFMPNLWMFSLRRDGYNRALKMYANAGHPDLLTFEGRDVFLQACAREEDAVLRDMVETPYEKIARANYGLHVLDGVRDMRPVVEAFWKTFHWTLHYFRTNDVLDWNWHYPYPDAPLVADIVQHDEYDWTKISTPPTFGIADQLAFILPASSLRVAKRRVVYPTETYDQTRELWLKKFDWEAEPRISLPWNPEFALTSVSELA
jgi:5'-3' exonuclease